MIAGFTSWLKTMASRADMSLEIKNLSLKDWNKIMNEKTMLIETIENYINKYVTLADRAYALPVALWILLTHCYNVFDVVPYLIITAFTPGAGKSRLMEIIRLVSRDGKTYSARSVASMFDDMLDENDQPLPELLRKDIFLDECEELLRPQHEAREFLNKGYKKGNNVTRKRRDIPAFCMKVFTLIGQVYDTLKDRSIVVVCRKRTIKEQREAIEFRTAIVEPFAAGLRKQASELVAAHISEIEEMYLNHSINLSFMTNERDAEIWQALFIICQIFCPERKQELTRLAVDMCMDKASDFRKSFGDEYERAKRNAEDESMMGRLMEDMLNLSEGKEFVMSDELIPELKALITSPWRKYKMTGITSEHVGHLLKSTGLKTSQIKRDGKNRRGYRRSDIVNAAVMIGLISPPE